MLSYAGLHLCCWSIPSIFCDPSKGYSIACWGYRWGFYLQSIISCCNCFCSSSLFCDSPFKMLNHLIFSSLWNVTVSLRLYCHFWGKKTCFFLSHLSFSSVTEYLFVFLYKLSSNLSIMSVFLVLFCCSFSYPLPVVSDVTICHLLLLPDIYLLGTVMLVFGMGLYELFISNLDKANSVSDERFPYRSNLFGIFTLKVFFIPW